mgnify:CR=1 FL=1
MGLVTVTHDEAKFAHQSFYEGDFEVVSMARSGFSDYFPFSLAYGISDIGSWRGLISTDGKKMVVTKSKALDLAKVKKSFEIEVADISKVKFNIAKTYFTFNKKILIHLQSEQIPHLRANLNSTLRLIQASYDSINSVKI